MSENSSIEWTDHTFNPWIGCTKVSPGCANDYGITLPPADELERGGIVGETEIVAWHDEAPEGMPFAFTSGLELRNSKVLPFHPCKGALGFFNVDGGAE